MNTIKLLSERIDENIIQDLINGGELNKDLLDGLTSIYAEHLIALADAGVIRPYNGAQNRRMNLLYSWNQMADTKGEEGRRLIEARHVANRLFPGFFHLRLSLLIDNLKRSGSTDSGEMHKAIASELDAGNIRWWTLSSQEYDFISGQDFAYELRDWNIQIGIRPEIRGRKDLVPVDDLPPPALQILEIMIPSGDLLIADWFRAEGFTDLVDEGQPWRGGSVLEDEADAERYVRDYGFISARSERRSLIIITDGKGISVGAYDEDGNHPLPIGWHQVGNILIDLRKISAVDREVLSAILHRIHSEERSREFSEQVATNSDTVRLKVTPGRYQAISSGRGYLEDLLPQDHSLKIPGFEPVLILEKI